MPKQHHNNIFWALKPYMVALNIFGLGCWSLKPHGYERNRRIFLWQILVLPTLCLLRSYIALTSITTQHQDSILTLLFQVVGIITGVSVYIRSGTFLFYGHQFVALINKFGYFSMKLSKYNLKLRYRFLRRILLVILVLIVINTIFVVKFRAKGVEKRGLPFLIISHCWAYITGTLGITTFAILAYILEKYFQTINVRLLAISRLVKRPRIFMKKFRVEIKTLMIYHFELCYLAQELNNFFSPILLMIFVYCVFWLTQKVYFLYDYNFDNFLEKMVNLFVMAYMGIPPTVTIFCCDRTESEVKKTAKALMAIKPIIGESQITNYFLQLKHRPVAFTAWDLFPLNKRVIVSITATICSCLMNALQFNSILKQNP